MIKQDILEIKDWTYEEFPEFTEIPEGGVRLESTGDERATFYANDVEYANIDGISLKLQVLMPLSRNEPEILCPCLVYIQGSGWMEQDTHHSVGKIARLADRGFVVAVVQYRHAGQAGFPAQIQDARNAVRFMRKHADIFHIMPDKIFLGGTSSGGHTAVMAAIAGAGEHPFYDRNIYPGISAGVCGVLDYYGCVSLQMADGFPSLSQSPVNGEMLKVLLSHVPEEDRESIWEKGTAVNYINKDMDLPPFFIIHGSKDRIVNTKQSLELYEKLKACEKEAYFYVLGGADHGGPEFWNTQVLDLAEAFMKKCAARQA